MTAPSTLPRLLTVRQPWADLIMAGVKDVENRSWAVPSTLPPWWWCPDHEVRYPPTTVACHMAAPHPIVADGPFPFRLWVHAAAKAVPFGQTEAWTAWYSQLDPARHGSFAERGVVLGSVEVTGCHHADEWIGWANWTDSGLCSRWAEPDVYHWTLTDPRPLATAIPAKGRLGLWRPDADLAAQLVVAA